MKYLLTFLLLTLFAGLAHGLTVATYNSSDSQKARADVVCTVKDATEVLQAAADKADKERDGLVLAGGHYFIKKTLTTHCEIRGIGAVRLQWTGPQTDGFILHHTGKSGKLHRPHLSGLLFDGNNKVGGLLVNDVHNATVENLAFYRCRGVAFQITKGWVLCLRNISARYCNNCRAFDFSGLSASTVDMLGMVHIKGDGPIVTITGCADIRQLGIQNCDAGENPVVLLRSFWSGSLSGYITEQNKGTAHLVVEDTIGARIDRLSHWQKSDNPMPDGVVLKNCKAIQFGSMRAWNISGAMLRIMADCEDILYDRRLIREGYAQDYGVQPKYIVREDGRGAKGD